MPVWHDRIADLVADGRVVELGVLQEQHPDRADLFMQWKQMEFPLLVDHFNVLEMTAVPVTVFIDEHGIVRDIPRRVRNPRAAVEAFLDATYDAPTTPPVTPTVTQPAGEPAAPPATGPPADVVAHAADLRHDARQAILERGDAALDSSIALFERAVSITPDDGRGHFSLGVALRMRVDSARARPDDFQRAIDAWGQALALDPNQYIWRRRIQQYGPRLDKPYPFLRLDHDRPPGHPRPWRDARCDRGRTRRGGDRTAGARLRSRRPLAPFGRSRRTHHARRRLDRRHDHPGPDDPEG